MMRFDTSINPPVNISRDNACFQNKLSYAKHASGFRDWILDYDNILLLLFYNLNRNRARFTTAEERYFICDYSRCFL